MKNTTDTAAGTEMPDFTRVNLNKYSDGELTQDIIFGYLTYMSKLLKLLCDKHTLLTKIDLLTHEEYKELFGYVFNLWNDLWQEKAVQKLFALTVEKGIMSLAEALKKDANPTKIAYHQQHPLWQWYCSIEYQLQAGARLGIGSHGINIEKSRELIESMVPLVQRMQSDMALESIARDRFPGDNTAMQAFVKANCNW